VVRIKICGITNREDALAAADGGADAVGFVFYPQSPRFVSPAHAAEIIAMLPPFVTPVGVFVDEEEQQIRQILRKCHIQVIQLHGNEPPHHCSIFREKVIKAFRVRDQSDRADRADTANDIDGETESLLRTMSDYPVDTFLLDTYSTRLLGGTGKTFNWERALQIRLTLSGIKPYSKIVLSGGLTPENAADAVKKVQPYAVDVSSGLESSPGKKDHQKIKTFIRAVRKTV
jgi:phosphoribosylanthranilate isomerase